MKATPDELKRQLETHRTNVSRKFPLWTALLATTGLVSVLYGLEKIIDRIDFFANYPWTLIIFGVVLLIVTGSTYKKL